MTMNHFLKIVVGALLSSATASAFAGAILVNSSSTVALGVNDQGRLNLAAGNIVNNAGSTGLAFNFGTASAPVWQDATSPGCECEGWGVSVNGTTSGFANISTDGIQNLTLDSFTSTGSTAVSEVSLSNLAGLSVKHSFAPSVNAPNELFRVLVEVTNTTGSDVTDLKYVRVMDWDVPPTEFNEFVSIRGTATTTLLELSHDDGFESANPLDTFSDEILPGTTNVDFIDSGPEDHGAFFRFNFGDLADGETQIFEIFYGAAGNEALALAAIGAEGIELFSLGQSNNAGVAANNDPTFIFGFRGVGGTPVIPPSDVPEPMTLSLMGLGLASLSFARRKKRI